MKTYKIVLKCHNGEVHTFNCQAESARNAKEWVCCVQAVPYANVISCKSVK